MRSYKRICIEVLRKIIFATLFASLLSFLGFFSGIGYHVIAIKESSFERSITGRFAYGTFYCDIIYNPLLFPLYWFAGVNRLTGNYTMIVVPEAYAPGEYGGPVYPRPDIRESDLYVTRMVIWGMPANFVFLLFISILLEILRKRIIYLAIFMGTAGFVIAGAIGAVVGSILGAFTIAYLLFVNKSALNMLTDYWNSLWE